MLHRQSMQAIQEGCPSGSANGKIATSRAEGQAVHISQGAPGCGPVGEHSEAGQVH